MRKNNENGFGIIEVLVVSTISITVLLGISGFLNYALKVSEDGTSKAEALYYAKSMIEQARAIRDENWDTNIRTLTVDANYYFQGNGANPEKWVAMAGENTMGKYTMKIIFSKVNRDGNDDIVSSGGTEDFETLKATSSVSYPTRDGLKQVELFEYLTNYN